MQLYKYKEKVFLDSQQKVFLVWSVYVYCTKYKNTYFPQEGNIYVSISYYEKNLLYTLLTAF